MDEVRTKRGLVYGISSTLDVSRDRGIFAITFSANPKNVRAADALVKVELNRIRTTPVTADELARARTKIIAGALVSEESTSALVGRVENIAMNRLPLDYYADLGSHYNAIAPNDILRVAKTYIHPDRMIEVYTGPKF
jgi:zinc protease